MSSEYFVRSDMRLFALTKKVSGEIIELCSFLPEELHWRNAQHAYMGESVKWVPIKEALHDLVKH